MKKSLSKSQKEEIAKLKRNFKIECFLIVILLAASVFFGYQLGINHINPLSSVSVRETANSEMNISLSCSGLELKETADCLVQNIRPFYKYKINLNGDNVPLEELKKNGGDCTEWSELYVRLIENIPNYYVRTFIVDANETTAHEFATISNSKGYCILDEANYVCFSYNGGT